MHTFLNILIRAAALIQLGDHAHALEDLQTALDLWQKGVDSLPDRLLKRAREEEAQLKEVLSGKGLFWYFVGNEIQAPLHPTATVVGAEIYILGVESSSFHHSWCRRDWGWATLREEIQRTTWARRTGGVEHSRPPEISLPNRGTYGQSYPMGRGNRLFLSWADGLRMTLVQTASLPLPCQVGFSISKAGCGKSYQNSKEKGFRLASTVTLQQASAPLLLLCWEAKVPWAWIPSFTTLIWKNEPSNTLTVRLCH